MQTLRGRAILPVVRVQRCTADQLLYPRPSSTSSMKKRVNEFCRKASNREKRKRFPAHSEASVNNVTSRSRVAFLYIIIAAHAIGRPNQADSTFRSDFRFFCFFFCFSALVHVRSFDQACAIRANSESRSPMPGFGSASSAFLLFGSFIPCLFLSRR